MFNTSQVTMKLTMKSQASSYNFFFIIHSTKIIIYCFVSTAISTLHSIYNLFMHSSMTNQKCDILLSIIIVNNYKSLKAVIHVDHRGHQNQGTNMASPNVFIYGVILSSPGFATVYSFTIN